MRWKTTYLHSLAHSKRFDKWQLVLWLPLSEVKSSHIHAFGPDIIYHQPRRKVSLAKHSFLKVVHYAMNKTPWFEWTLCKADRHTSPGVYFPEGTDKELIFLFTWVSGTSKYSTFPFLIGKRMIYISEIEQNFTFAELILTFMILFSLFHN